MNAFCKVAIVEDILIYFTNKKFSWIFLDCENSLQQNNGSVNRINGFYFEVNNMKSNESVGASFVSLYRILCTDMKVIMLSNTLIIDILFVLTNMFVYKFSMSIWFNS